MATKLNRITINVPAALGNRLVRGAAASHRSLSAHVVHLLDRRMKSGRGPDQRLQAAAGKARRKPTA